MRENAVRVRGRGGQIEPITLIHPILKSTTMSAYGAAIMRSAIIRKIYGETGSTIRMK